jgi:hypothetical protein
MTALAGWDFIQVSVTPLSPPSSFATR